MKKKIRTAKWLLDYDITQDKTYRCPMCPDCYAPVMTDADGKYRCASCGQEYVLTEGMIEWLKKREETKIEMVDCDIHVSSKTGKTYGCGGKGCVEKLYIRNPVTLEWQQASSECKKCGRKIIV